MNKKNNTYKKDLNPLHYKHKHASLKRFAEHLRLVGKRLHTAQSYYRPYLHLIPFGRRRALPSGFHHNRYYGFMHPTNRKLLQPKNSSLMSSAPLA